jgi:parallel beta-helix repeat protein
VSYIRPPAGRRRRIWAASSALSALAVVTMVIGVPAGTLFGEAQAAALAVPSGVGVQSSDCPSGLASASPIVVNTDADWASVPGIAGNGTMSSPYVISCLSITGYDSSTGAAIYVAPADVSYVIRDVAVTGQASAPEGIAVSGSTVGTAVVAHDSISGYSAGLVVNGASASIGLDDNLISGAAQQGITVVAAQTNTDGNFVSGQGTSWCENVTDYQSGQVSNDSCVGGWQKGFVVYGPGSSGLPLSVTGNVSKGNIGAGFTLENFLSASSNTADDNGEGVFVSGTAQLINNTIDSNKGAGIDLGGCSGCTISDNSIEDNGDAAMVASPAYTGDPALATNNVIEGNHIGGSPFGIAFSYGASTGNTVVGTDWTDGNQSYVRFGDDNTIVDAGSAVRAVAGSPASFADWIIHVVPGTVGPSGTDTLASATGATFSFGDGTSQNITPDQFTNTGALLSHIYSSTGTYTATLTVHATDTADNPVTLTDTTPVTIVSPTPTTSLFSQAGDGPWSMLGNTPDRPFYNANETTIDSSTVNQLVEKWRFPTVYPVSASPAVGQVDLPTVTGGTPVPTTVVYDGSFDGTFYAVNDATGLPVWQTCLVTSSVYVTSEASCNPSYPGNPNAQTDYGAIVASPEFVTLPSGTEEVLAAANATMNALDPATGQVLWSFTGGSYVQADAGTTGASVSQTCVPPGTSGATSGSPYDIESSPVVVGDTVYFGMDSNGECDQAGGVYAIDATTGAMKWFFDPAAGQVFYPPNSSTTSWDPNYDLVNGALVPGYTCGGVWTSPAIDVSSGLLFDATANCPHDPIPPYEEGAFALNLSTGAPVWDYQPRQIDSLDMDFGATPNVFMLGSEHVVGFASKDGTYTLLDDQTGNVIWRTKVIGGGAFGGFYNAVTDGNYIFLNSAIGEASGFAATPYEDSLKGREFALDARTGNVVWRSYAGAPNLGQDAAVNGVYFTSGLDHALHAFSTQSGQLLDEWPVGGAVTSGPAIYSGELFVGAGTGATLRSAVGASVNPISGGQPAFPHPIPIYEYGQGIYGFCIASNPSCYNALNKINAGRDTTSVSYTGPTSGTVDQPVTFSANLEDNTVSASPTPVSNRSVTFSITPNGLDGSSASYTQSCTATTDANGNASCQITLDQPVGTSTITTTFSGDSTYQPSSTTTQFTVNAAPTTLKYTGDTSVADGGTGNVSALLTETASGDPIQGRAVTFTLGSGSGAQSCTGTTDSTGTASCTIDPVIQPLDSPGTVTASFAGDDFYSPASASAAVSYYAYTGSSGSFVIGDGNAAVGSSVTFWGNGWGSANTLSGGNAAGSGFKGYATNPNPSPPSCGGTWTSPTGNSSPPGSVPSYMAVVVSSDITEPNSTTAQGNVVEIVVIATNAGYNGKLNQPGTGTVLGVICQT